MPSAEAHVWTARAERYLSPLVDHLSQLGQHCPAHQSEQHGHAGAEALARGRDLIADRVETIGRRDELMVTWNPTLP
ncbi:hypothetical protein [Nocardioides sp. AN3]